MDKLRLYKSSDGYYSIRKRKWYLFGWDTLLTLPPEATSMVAYRMFNEYAKSFDPQDSPKDVVLDAWPKPKRMRAY